ncbi:hypothetical protein ACNVD4_19670, partial [Rhizobium sp. BR5]
EGGLTIVAHLGMSGS